MNELHMRHNASIAGYRVELAKLERETDEIIRSIQQGVSGTLLAKRSHYVQGRKEELEALLASTKEEKVLFHPMMANRYQKEIRHLLSSLNAKEGRAEAITILRSLIDRIVITPTETGDRLTVDLMGDLAGILSIATAQDRRAVADDLSRVQPVQQTEHLSEPEKGKAAQNGGLFPKAMVAGTRTERQQPSLQTGRLPFLSGSQEALVAGAGFEPAAFRL